MMVQQMTLVLPKSKSLALLPVNFSADFNKKDDLVLLGKSALDLILYIFAVYIGLELLWLSLSMPQGPHL